MLIGIDASRANRKFKSGTEWYSYYLIRELAKIDSVNQYVLYTDKPLVSGLVDLTADGDEIDGEGEVILEKGYQKIKSPYSNFRVKILNWPFSCLWTQLRLSWEMLCRSPDILFIPAHTLPFVHPKKSLVTIHDIGFRRDRELYSSDDIRPAGDLRGKIIAWLVKIITGGKSGPNVLDYHDWSTRFMLKHAKKIIAVSQFTKSELTAVYGAADSKIEVVYNGFNVNLYRPVADGYKIKRVLDRYGIKSPYVFYVGRLEKKKNIVRLINAFAMMREKHKNIKHKLILAGNASWGFDEIKYAIEEFDLDNEIVITGWVPEQDMPYIYSGAALFIFPSLYEGFGIPLLQAMASAVPAVASNIAPLREIAASAALFFNPKDENDMAEKMAEVLLDKKLAADLIEKGQARVKDFSLTKCAQETLAVMEKM